MIPCGAGTAAVLGPSSGICPRLRLGQKRWQAGETAGSQRGHKGIGHARRRNGRQDRRRPLFRSRFRICFPGLADSAWPHVGGCACRSRPLVPSGRAGRLRRIRDPFGRGPDLAGIGYGQDGRAGGTACPARPTPGPAIGLRRNTPSNRPVCPCGMIRQNPAPLPRDFLQGQVSGPAAWRMFGAGVAGPGQGSCGSASLLPPAGAPLCRWPSGRPGSWVKGTFARFRADFAIRLHRTSPCRGNGILPRGASLAKTERAENPCAGLPLQCGPIRWNGATIRNRRCLVESESFAQSTDLVDSRRTATFQDKFWAVRCQFDPGYTAISFDISRNIASVAILLLDTEAVESGRERCAIRMSTRPLHFPWDGPQNLSLHFSALSVQRDERGAFGIRDIVHRQ